MSDLNIDPFGVFLGMVILILAIGGPIVSSLRSRIRELEELLKEARNAASGSNARKPPNFPG